VWFAEDSRGAAAQPGSQHVERNCKSRYVSQRPRCRLLRNIDTQAPFVHPLFRTGVALFLQTKVITQYCYPTLQRISQRSSTPRRRKAAKAGSFGVDTTSTKHPRVSLLWSLQARRLAFLFPDCFLRSSLGCPIIGLCCDQPAMVAWWWKSRVSYMGGGTHHQWFAA